MEEVASLGSPAFGHRRRQHQGTILEAENSWLQTAMPASSLAFSFSSSNMLRKESLVFVNHGVSL